MKSKMYYAFFVAILAAGFFASCDSKAKKVENAQENVQDAQQALKEAQRELNKEYPAFRIDAEKKIAANEVRIQELSDIINQPGDKLHDDLRRRRITELKLINADLRNRLDIYEKENSDWEVFKREFNQDMNGLLESLKDIGRNNKN
jgi:DNA repair ATPase RecN